MAISDKTRKILWARSGNRCAMCRCKLVREKTTNDPEAVVGDECHIISKQTNGPRHVFVSTDIDFDYYDNLILLCQTHHKLVDDQPKYYTVAYVKSLKNDHELWANKVLDRMNSVSSISIRAEDARIEEAINLAEEIDKEELSDLHKYFRLAYEEAKRGLISEVLTEWHQEFWKWLSISEQKVGRGVVCVAKDGYDYVSAEIAYQNVSSELTVMIASYDIGTEFVVAVEIEKPDGQMQLHYRTRRRLFI